MDLRDFLGELSKTCVADLYELHRNVWFRDPEQLACELVKGSYLESTGCLVYTKSQYPSGYGRIRMVKAHRLSFILFKGPLDGLYECHDCDNKPCILPSHLYKATNEQNQLDASRKGLLQKHWTPEKRLTKSVANSGSGNPMFGRTGPLAPCYGRTGEKHPMFGTHHTEEAKAKISKAMVLRHSTRKGFVNS